MKELMDKIQSHEIHGSGMRVNDTFYERRMHVVLRGEYNYTLYPHCYHVCTV